MYMRNYLAPEVLPDELPREKVKEVSEVKITLDMLQRGLDGWYTEAKRLLECEFTMAFSEKYFTQEYYLGQQGDKKRRSLSLEVALLLPVFGLKEVATDMWNNFTVDDDL